jgi:hypothetical protein
MNINVIYNMVLESKIRFRFPFSFIGLFLFFLHMRDTYVQSKLDDFFVTELSMNK